MSTFIFCCFKPVLMLRNQTCPLQQAFFFCSQPSFKTKTLSIYRLCTTLTFFFILLLVQITIQSSIDDLFGNSPSKQFVQSTQVINCGHLSVISFYEGHKYIKILILKIHLLPVFSSIASIKAIVCAPSQIIVTWHPPLISDALFSKNKKESHVANVIGEKLETVSYWLPLVAGVL